MEPFELTCLRLAWDPVSYHPAWRGLAIGLTGDRRSAINQWIVEHYQLPKLEEGDAAVAPRVRRVIEAWHWLSDAALLMAYAKLRRQAMAHRDFMRTPTSARLFAQLGFAELSLPDPQPMSASALRRWGEHYVGAGLLPALPPWLAARCRLRFAELEVLPGVTPENFDYPCFWSALRHAQTTQSSPS